MRKSSKYTRGIKKICGLTVKILKLGTSFTAIVTAVVPKMQHFGFTVQ